MLTRSIEVVVIRGQTGLFEPFGLIVVEHAERAHATHHLEHVVERGPVLDLAPGRAHAKAGRARLARRLRGA